AGLHRRARPGPRGVHRPRRRRQQPAVRRAQPGGPGAAGRRLLGGGAAPRGRGEPGPRLAGCRRWP
ncbi:MAG: hypothetical protein AVDCRST_MAG24-870, partial [uncultured Nocardioidaceae bacterium]